MAIGLSTVFIMPLKCYFISRLYFQCFTVVWKIRYSRAGNIIKKNSTKSLLYQPLAVRTSRNIKVAYRINVQCLSCLGHTIQIDEDDLVKRAHEAEVLEIMYRVLCCCCCSILLRIFWLRDKTFLALH